MVPVVVTVPDEAVVAIIEAEVLIVVQVLIAAAVVTVGPKTAVVGHYVDTVARVLTATAKIALLRGRRRHCGTYGHCSVVCRQKNRMQ